MGVRFVALFAGWIGEPGVHPEPRALSERRSPDYGTELRLRIVAGRRGVVAPGNGHPRHHRLGLRRHLLCQLLPERDSPDHGRQADCRCARDGSRAQPRGGARRNRSGRADDHIAERKGASLRDRSAPSCRFVERPRRDRADTATRRRNPRLSGRRPNRAAVDSSCKESGMSTSSNMMKIAVVGGEGIGPEVTAQSRRILDWFASKRNVPMVSREAQYGLIPYLATGKVLPPDTAEAMEEADAILWGATGGPETKEVPAEARKAGGLLSLRSKYDLYANLRPIRANPALSESAPLKARVLKDVDFVIIRELTSGIYFGEPRGIEKLADGQRRGFNTEQYTTSQVRRVARSAFELARTRRNKVCSVDKANVLETSVLWREEVTALHAEEFRDVELSHMYVDNAAMQIVRDPAQFDVMVTGNIFGDILSDCAAMASGSLGMLPSASLGPVDRYGRRKALYEPVHGGAPDIAGHGIANPLGSIQSVIMMLRMTLDRPDDADLLEKAVDLALASGARTADIAEPGARKLSTKEMGDAVLAALDKVSSSVKEKA